MKTSLAKLLLCCGMVYISSATSAVAIDPVFEVLTKPNSTLENDKCQTKNVKLSTIDAACKSKLGLGSSTPAEVWLVLTFCKGKLAKFNVKPDGMKCGGFLQTPAQDCYDAVDKACGIKPAPTKKAADAELLGM